MRTGRSSSWTNPRASTVVPSQPGEGVRISVVEAVERDFGFRPFLVHRLDRETAGCLIVARSAAAAGRWSRLIESRELRKTYRAVVAWPARPPELWGAFPTRCPRGAAGGGEGRFHGMAAPGLLRPGRGRSRGRGFGEALFLSRARARDRPDSSDQAPPRLSRPAHPLEGDDRHGDFALNKLLRKEAGLKRLLLLSWSLVLPGGPVVRASLPEHFSAFFAAYPDAPSARGGS